MIENDVSRARFNAAVDGVLLDWCFQSAIKHDEDRGNNCHNETNAWIHRQRRCNGKKSFTIFDLATDREGRRLGHSEEHAVYVHNEDVDHGIIPNIEE